MNKTTVSKIFSISLSLALAVTSAPIPAGAAGPMGPAAPAFVAKLTPPEQFGYVASSYSPNATADRPRLIVIADLHGHEEVQRNIVGMLEHFINRLTANQGGQSQTQVPVYVEGGWRDHLEEPLSSSKDSETRRLVAEYLGRRSELHPAQLYSERHAGSGKIRVIGVENKELYDANGARFKESYPGRKVLLEAIARHEEALTQLRETIEPSGVTKLHDLRIKYEKGMVAPARYASVLYRQAVRLGIGGKWVDILQQPSNSRIGDLEVALTLVHQQVSQKLAQKKPVSAYFRKELEKEDVIRQSVAKADSLLDLLKRLAGDQLTPDEVSLALGKLPELERVANVLIGKEELGINIRETLVKALEFYPYAILRDKALLDNSLAALDKDANHAPTGILVVGGFHTGAIVDSLRAKNIAFMLVHPTITRDLTADEELNYIKLMFGEHVTVTEMIKDLSEKSWAKELVNNTAAGAPVTSDRQSVEGGDHFDGFMVEAASLRAQLADYRRVEGALNFANESSPAAVAARVAANAGWLRRAWQALWARVAPSALRLQADINARTRTVLAALKYDSKTGNAIYKGSLDASQASTLRVKGNGTFEVQGVVGDAGMASAMATFAGMAQAAFGEKLPTLEKIHFQGVNGELSEVLEKDSDVQYIGHDMAVLRTRGKEAVVLYNVNKPMITTEVWNETRKDIQLGRQLSPVAQSIVDDGVQKMHELMHVLTHAGRKGQFGEATTQVNALAVMGMAAIEGMDDVVTMSVQGTAQHSANAALGRFFAGRPANFFPVIGEEGVTLETEDVARRQQQLQAQIVEAIENSPEVLTITSLKTVLEDFINPAALDNVRVVELANKMRTEFGVDADTLSDVAVDQILNSIASDMSTRVKFLSDKALEAAVRQRIQQLLVAAYATRKSS